MPLSGTAAARAAVMLSDRWLLPGLALLLFLLLLLATSCADEEPYDPDAEYGMNGPVEPTPPPGKEDGPHRQGLPVTHDGSRTEVWPARNRWEDRDTPAARRAGLAWGEDSGLSWDEKYARWVGSLERVSGASGFETIRLTTPWGKTLESPSLECAELSIFLRVSFAAWYELPFFMEAVDRDGTRIYFGHAGVRTAAGRYAGTPEYRVRYRDHSAMSAAEALARWPRDEALRARRLGGGPDGQPALGGASFGAFADEVHLNKRAGHFLLLALNYLGSVHLADPANTYNLVPEAVRPGDTLVARWQRAGIGHTLVVVDAVEIGEGALEVALVSGSMPRRQARWETGEAVRLHFTDARTGGEGVSPGGEPYARLGGGLKRWRVARAVAGRWSNTWMRGDEAHWIDSRDLARIAARPARFARLLGPLDPDQARLALLAMIEDARSHLRGYPASCAARERRERAFAALHDLLARERGLSRAEVDALHRTEEDYVFAALEYGRSRTCCWNSTTTAMHQVVMDLAARERAEAEAAGTCRAPSIFMHQADGYERWRRLAVETGRGALWAPWSEDEHCPQRGVAIDAPAGGEVTPYCSWREAAGPGGGGVGCTDPMEPNQQPLGAPALAPGAVHELEVCEGDSDWFAVPAGGAVRIDFSHAAGDLDLSAHDASGGQLDASQGTGDREEVSVPPGGRVRVYGWRGATGSYRISAP